MKQSTLPIERPKDSLVRVGAHERSLKGWNYTGVESHLTHHIEGGKPWCDVDCLSRTFLGKVSPRNRKGVRQRLRGIVRRLIMRKSFLVIEYAPRKAGTHGEAQRFKIFEGSTPDEIQAAIDQLEAMKKRRDVSDSLYESARIILCVPMPAQELHP